MRPLALLGLAFAPGLAQAGFYTPDEYDDPGDPLLGAQELRVEWFWGQQAAGALFEDEKEPIGGWINALAYRHSVLLTPFLTAQVRVGRVHSKMLAGEDHGWVQNSIVADTGVGFQHANARLYGLYGVWDRTRVKPALTLPTRSQSSFGQVSVGIEGLYNVNRNYNKAESGEHRKDQLMLWMGLAAEYRRTRLQNNNGLTFLPADGVPANALMFTVNFYYMVGV